MEKKNESKGNSQNCFFITIVIVGIVITIAMIGAYLCMFNDGFSNRNSDWGEFGSYFGSIMSALAFIGIIATLYFTKIQNAENEKQHNETNERDYFFKMLDLHNSKFQHIEFQNNKVSHKGAEAFKEYVEIANNYFIFTLICRFLKTKLENEDIDKLNSWLKDNHIHGKDHFTNDKYNNIHSLLRALDAYSELNPASTISNFTSAIAKVNSAIDNNSTKLPTINLTPKIIKSFMLKADISIDNLFESLVLTSNCLYHHYGHTLGHYYRNLYYSMMTIENFTSSKKDEYVNILRAQPTRYEIALLFYDMMSNKSSENMNRLTHEVFDIFGGIYYPDVIIFNWIDDIQFDTKETEGEKKCKALLVQLMELAKKRLIEELERKGRGSTK